MKHKRMAILFVLVTFAGAPPVWQKLGNFIAAVQHRAQVKFLSMVLSSGPDEAETLTVPTTLNEHVASCPGPAVGHMPNAVASQPRSSARKTKPERRDATTPEETKTVALKHAAKDDKIDSLSHLAGFLPETQNRLTMHAIAAIPKNLTTDESGILEFVVSPQGDSVMPAFVESWNRRLKVRRAVEVNKVGRQRTRYVISKPLLASPASKADATSNEREG